ncbi:MAG: flagellar hook-associated protein FlgK [Lachnospiraceae bacterium]|nr:flagellar hook-associated protein FlgK [Lachnospiraceae bacterium]
MPNTFFGLTIGTTGMYGANIGINTTAHNITNTETEGYSRQIVEKRADSALRANNKYGMIGTGVTVTNISQQRDEYYDEKYRSNNTLSGYYSAQEYYMHSIEDYFNEVRLEGFNSNFNSFNDALQELAKDPSSLTARTQANSFAQNFCEYVNSMNTSMEQLQESVNFEIKTMADQINSYAAQIAGMTKQINTLEVTGGTANDLRDQRNLLIDKLSNIVDIDVEEHVVGQDSVGVTSYTVMIGDSVLVDTYNWNTLNVVPRQEKYNQSDIDGLYDLEWPSGQRFQGLHNGGRVQALFEVRDGNSEQYFNGTASGTAGDTTITVTDTSINKLEQIHLAEQGIITIGNKEYTYNGFRVTQDDDGKFVYEFALDNELVKDYDEAEVRVGESISYKGITYYMQQLDEFTRVFAQKYNDIHKQGVDLKNRPGLDYFNSKNRVSGENYTFEYSEDEENDGILVSTKTGAFKVEDEDKNYGSYYFMTAKGFGVTKQVYDDPDRIVTATNVVDGEANNDIAYKIIDLRDDQTMFRQGTPAGFLQSLIAELGVDAHKAKSFDQNQKDIVSNIDNQRLSVSGVDIDEEAMNLVRYQNTYNLSAKVISTMDELYDRLINWMAV